MGKFAVRSWVECWAFWPSLCNDFDCLWGRKCVVFVCESPTAGFFQAKLSAITDEGVGGTTFTIFQSIKLCKFMISETAIDEHHTNNVSLLQAVEPSPIPGHLANR
jgi:hypothetical protein